MTCLRESSSSGRRREIWGKAQLLRAMCGDVLLVCGAAV